MRIFVIGSRANVFVLGFIIIVSNLQVACVTPSRNIASSKTQTVSAFPDNTDIHQFCEDNSRAGIAEFAFHMNDEELQTRLKKNDLSLFTEKNAPDAWEGSLYPNETSRLLNHRHHYPDGIKIFPGESPEQAMIRFFKNIPENNLKNFDAGNDGLSFKIADDITKNKAQLKVADFDEMAVCALYGFKSMNYCVTALDRIVQIVHPGDTTNSFPAYNLYPVFREVAHNPIYSKVAPKIAIKIEQKIDQGGVPQGNLWQDVYESFFEEELAQYGNDTIGAKNALKTGLVQNSALEDAFTFLAVYSSDGPNTFMIKGEFFNRDTAPLFYALMAVGTGISVLDSRSSQSGHNYSLPPEVQSSCDTGKPYHFWLSAYLAHRLTEEYDDPTTAITGTFLAEVGYQMMSKSVGRDPARAFIVNAFDPNNNKIRMDVALATAGAIYGADTALGGKLPKILNVDEALRRMLKDAQPQSLLTRAEAESRWDKGYYRWKSIFAPDSALNYYLNDKP